MKMTNRRPSNKAPQRRNRGTRIRTAPTISPTPSASAPGKASVPGTRNSSSIWDHLKGSVSFHAPETKNRIATSTAQTPPMVFFQAGKSKLARSKPTWAGFAVVSDIGTFNFTGSKELLGGLHRPRDVLLGMCGREKPGFELRRREVNPAIQHPVEELAKPAGIGPLSGFPIGHWSRCEEEGEHRSYAVYRDPRRHVGS